MIFLQVSGTLASPLMKALALILLIGVIAFRYSLIFKEFGKNNNLKKRKTPSQKKVEPIPPYEKYLKGRRLLTLKENRFHSPLYSTILPNGLQAAIITNIVLLILATSIPNKIISSIVIISLFSIWIRALAVTYKYISDREFKFLIIGLYIENMSKSPNLVGKEQVSLSYFKKAAELHPRLYTCAKVARLTEKIEFQVNGYRDDLSDYQEVLRWLNKGIDNSEVIVPKVLKRRVYCLESELRFEEAIRDCDQLRSIEGKHKDGALDWLYSSVYYHWGRYLVTNQELSTAREKLEKALKSSRQAIENLHKEMKGSYRFVDPEILYLQAHTHLIEQEYDLAKEGFKELLEHLFTEEREYFDHNDITPRYRVINNQIQRVYKLTDDYGGLVRLYASIIAKGNVKSIALVYLDLIDLFRKSGNRQQAIELFHTYEEEFSDFSKTTPLHQELKVLSSKTQNDPNISMNIKDLAPDLKQDYYFVNKLMEVGEIDKAALLITSYLSLNNGASITDLLEWYKLLVQIHQGKWEFQKAIELCDDILENLQEGFVWFYVKIIEILMNKGQLEEANELMKTLFEKSDKKDIDYTLWPTLLDVYTNRFLFQEAFELAESVGLCYFENYPISAEIVWKDQKSIPVVIRKRIYTYNTIIDLKNLEWKALARQDYKLY